MSRPAKRMNFMATKKLRIICSFFIYDGKLGTKIQKKNLKV